MRGRNVFFTGSAGTGKSFLLKRLVQRLKAEHDSECVFVTASTGIAACAIDGVTVHRCVVLRLKVVWAFDAQCGCIHLEYQP